MPGSVVHCHCLQGYELMYENRELSQFSCQITAIVWRQMQSVDVRSSPTLMLSQYLWTTRSTTDGLWASSNKGSDNGTQGMEKKSRNWLSLEPSWQPVQVWLDLSSTTTKLRAIRQSAARSNGVQEQKQAPDDCEATQVTVYTPCVCVFIYVFSHAHH